MLVLVELCAPPVGMIFLFATFLLTQVSYQIVWGGGVGNVIWGNFSLSFCCLFSHTTGCTMPHFMSPWEDVHPLKWVRHPQKLDICPRKSLSPGSRLGQI